LDPKDIVRDFHSKLWADGDIGAIDRFVASDATTAMTGFVGTAVDVLREDVERYKVGFAEVQTEIVEMLGDADRVVTWWRTSGTHVGPYGDIAPIPTGRRITMEGVDFFTVVDHRIVEIRSFWDAATVYRQFGLLPEGL
jgi:predicted ester cyclase